MTLPRNTTRNAASALALILLAGACSVAGEESAFAPPLDILVPTAPGETPVPYSALATGTVKFSPSVLPAAWEFIQPRPNCAFPRPSAAAKIVYTYSYAGGSHTPAQYVEGNDANTIAAIRRAREAARPTSFEGAAIANEASTFMTSNAIEWTGQVDVLVTETERPVFLYLASYDPVLWNIQLAPGAKIDGIVVNAYEGGVIANGVDASRTAILSHKSARAADCDRPDEEKVPKLYGRKVDLQIERISGAGAFRALQVGPVPAQPFTPQPITRLQIHSIAHPFWGGREAAFQAFGAKGSR